MSQPPSGNGRAQLLDEHALRYLFNTRILRQVLCGPLVAAHRLDKELTPKRLQQLTTMPQGTRRQYIDYSTPEGEFVCGVYPYLLPGPDRLLGASGLPDPKLVVYNGVIYGLKPKQT